MFLEKRKLLFFAKNKYLVITTFNLNIEKYRKWVDIEAILLGYGFKVDSRFICMGKGNLKIILDYWFNQLMQLFERRYWWRKVWPMYQRLCPRSRTNSRSPCNEQGMTFWILFSLVNDFYITVKAVLSVRKQLT